MTTPIQFGEYGEPQLLLLALLAYSRETTRDHTRVFRNAQRLSADDHQWLGQGFTLAQSIKEGVQGNQAFFNSLVRFSGSVSQFQVKTFPESLDPEELIPYSVRVRHLLPALAREWTSDGDVERKQSFGLISELVGKYLQSKSNILVPGASLGRLSHELATLEHQVTAVEDDLLKSVTYQFLRSASTACFYPYILNTCNRRNPEDHAVALKFPDDAEIIKSPVNYVTDDFFQWATESEQKFDAIATSFFLDACDTSIVKLTKIFSLLLKQGGVWINFGSLQYEGDVRRDGHVYEASAEEVLMVVSKCGFELLEHGFVKTSYMANPRSLMFSEHDALFFVARKM
jgi:hypothetical protein